MRGLSVKFISGASDVVPEEKNDFELVLQNMLINLGQAAGSSKMFPDKGTTMLRDALAGGILDSASANRVGGNAAVDTIFFLRAHEVDGVETLRDLSVVPEVYENGALKFQVSLKSTLDRAVGVVLSL